MLNKFPLRKIQLWLKLYKNKHYYNNLILKPHIEIIATFYFKTKNLKSLNDNEHYSNKWSEFKFIIDWLKGN